MTTPGKGRYETVRDYLLLGGGAILILAGVGIAITRNPVALGLIGAGMTCWGLVPTMQRDKQ